MQRSVYSCCQKIKIIEMKNLFGTIVLITILTIVSCKKTKNEDNSSSQNLVLLQHKWSLVSRYGEVFRYIGTPGDYYNFTTNNILYTHIENRYDTGFYSLLPDGTDISVYPIVNGIKSNMATNYYINTVSNIRLVISGGISPSLLFTDSLKR